MDISFTFLAQISFPELDILLPAGHLHSNISQTSQTKRLQTLSSYPPFLPLKSDSFIYLSGTSVLPLSCSRQMPSSQEPTVSTSSSPSWSNPTFHPMLSDAISPRLCAPVPRACSQYLKCEGVPSRNTC